MTPIDETSDIPGPSNGDCYLNPPLQPGRTIVSISLPENGAPDASIGGAEISVASNSTIGAPDATAAATSIEPTSLMPESSPGTTYASSIVLTDSVTAVITNFGNAVTDTTSNQLFLDSSDNGIPDSMPPEIAPELTTTSDKQLVVYTRHGYQLTTEDDDHELEYTCDKSLIDYAWSRRILELVSNKSKLMESFSWLSTVGGGFSALGERDKRFSARAGALSLGQQLRLAEQLGDERLRVMCHLFAALAALQLDNKMICLNYIRRVIIPLINAMPYRDPILTNILKHICFRISAFDRLVAGRQKAIEESRKHMELTERNRRYH